MRRSTIRLIAIVQIGLMLFTGCHPTQPFFIQRDPSLANYIAQQVDIEYADVHVDSLPEATDTLVPYGPTNLPSEYVELTLEDCISMALQNAKIVRVVPGYNAVTGPVSATQLSAQPGQMPSIYDPALAVTTSNTQPLTIDSQGTRVAPRGAVRSNQVGGVEDALAEFDAQFSALMGYNTTDRPRNVGPGNDFNPQLFDATDANAQAAISKRHATGTITSIRATSVYSRNNIPVGIGRAVPSDYTAALELQVNQPLLRGRGTLINRIPLILARGNEEIATREFEIAVRNLVQSVEHAYWDLYCDYRAFDAASRSRDRALTVWQTSYAKLSVGEGDPAAVSNARGRYFQFQAQMQAALYGSNAPGSDPNGVFGSERRLRHLIGWGANDDRCIRPSDAPNFARVHFNWHEAVAEALVRNSELNRQKWAIKQDELELISARNQVLPQLDLVGFYRWLGVGDELAAADRSSARFPGAGTNALQELTSGNYQEVGARIEFTPQAFGKRRANSNIQSSRLNLKKTQAEMQDKEIAMVFELADAWAQIEASFQQMFTQEQRFNAIEEEISAYEAKFEEGADPNLSNLLDLLLRAEELRAQTETQYFAEVCEYNKAIANFHLLKGSLLDLNNIQLREGAWVDKAYWDAEERARERAGGIYFDYGYTRPSVVSNGPVHQGEYYGTPAINTYQDSAPATDTLGSESDMPEVVAPPASIMETDAPELPTDSNPMAELHRGSSVEQASASTGGYEWGDLGMQDGRPAPQVVTSGARYSLTDSSGSPQSNSRNTRRIVTRPNQSYSDGQASQQGEQIRWTRR